VGRNLVVLRCRPGDPVDSDTRLRQQPSCAREGASPRYSNLPPGGRGGTQAFPYRENSTEEKRRTNERNQNQVGKPIARPARAINRESPRAGESPETSSLRPKPQPAETAHCSSTPGSWRKRQPPKSPAHRPEQPHPAATRAKNNRPSRKPVRQHRRAAVRLDPCHVVQHRASPA